MFQIISLAVLIVSVWYMISIRGKAKAGQVTDSLTGGEKIYIWISSLLNPIFSGAVFYYGWKKMMPRRAKQANSISLWAFVLELVLGFLYIFLIAKQ